MNRRDAEVAYRILSGEGVRSIARDKDVTVKRIQQIRENAIAYLIGICDPSDDEEG